MHLLELEEIWQRNLQKRGYNLILVARDEQKLKEVSEEIKNIYKVEAKVIQKTYL